MPPKPAKESMPPRRRKRPCGAKSKKRAEDCFWSLQTLFAPFNHKAQRTSTNSAPPSGPPSLKQRATESPASIFGLKLFARFLDERLLSPIRIDQLFWARLRPVPLNRPSGLLVRCFRVLSLNARATGDEPLPRALHSPANPRAQSPGAVNPGIRCGSDVKRLEILACSRRQWQRQWQRQMCRKPGEQP